MLERWTRVVLRRRALILGGWTVVVLLGALSGANLSGHLSTTLSVPGSASARANVILQRNFGENVEGTFTVVAPTRGLSPGGVRTLEARVDAAARALPGSHVTQQRALFGLLYVNVTTSASLNHAADLTPRLRAALAARGLRTALVTGPPALQHDLTPILQTDLRDGEVIAVLVALALLVAVLGLCGALVVPFAVAAASVAGTLGVVFTLAQRFTMVLYIPNVIELIGLGLAIDYALLLVHRFRTEVDVQGATTDDAVVATMNSAGRAVATSGVAVALGLAALLFVPVPFLRSLGIAGLCVPLITLACAFTLVPVLLSLLGARGARAKGPAGLLGGGDPLHGWWARVTRTALARPARVGALTALALLACASGTLWLGVTPAAESAIPAQVPAARALALVRATIGPGVSTPIEIVIDTGAAGATASATEAAGRLRLATSMLHDPEVFLVATGSKEPYVDATRRYERLFVVARHDFGDPATRALVERITGHLVASAHLPAAATVDVGGAPAQGVDFLATLYRFFWWIVAAVLALACLVLARAFRSLTLALLAVGLDVLSLAAAYGLVVAVFRGGVGAALVGLYQVPQIEGWVPVFLFGVLFGLSSDYEVFIVARIREAHDAGASTSEAILEGVARTGGVVSAAALIMVGALGGLALGRIAGLEELGVGLALGVVVDATIVRALLLPSLMALLGERCWWMPPALGRLVRVDAPPPGRDGASTVAESLT